MPEDYPRLPRMGSKELRSVLYSNLPGNPWREACKTELDLRTTTRMEKATYVILFAALLQIALAAVAITTGWQNNGNHNLSAREEFQRKVDCEKYASEVQSGWNEEEHENLTKWKITSEDLVRHDDIVRLFFSSQRNSCVCAVREQFLFSKSSPPNYSYQAYVFDVLTKEQIWAKEFGSDPTNVDKEIQEQLKKLE